MGRLRESGKGRIITAMPLEVLQRQAWNGEPMRLGSMFTVHKRGRTATCELWTHILGWELRLITRATLLQSQVCGAQDDVLAAQEAWRMAMADKGVALGPRELLRERSRIAWSRSTTVSLSRLSPCTSHRGWRHPVEVPPPSGVPSPWRRRYRCLGAH